MKLPTREAIHLRSFQIPAKAVWKNDSSAWSILWTSQGRARIDGAKGADALEPGAVVIAPKGMELGMRSDGGRAVCAHGLYFDPEHLPCIFSPATRLLFQRITRDYDRPTLLHKRDSIRSLLTALAAQTVPTPLKGNGERPVEATGHSCPCAFMQRVVPVMEELMRLLGKPSDPAEAASRRVAVALEGLSGQDLQSLSIDELARRCGLSRRHLARLLRRNGRPTLASLVIQARLDRAASLLHDPERKILDVALECGFRHLGVFTARFRNRFGVNPSVWRKQQSAARPTQG